MAADATAYFWSDRYLTHNKIKCHNSNILLPDDQFLVSFLRGCKYSYEKSKEKLDMYFTVRSAIPEFFSDRDPTYKNLKEAICQGYGE